jgi:hypothetical protein
LRRVALVVVCSVAGRPCQQLNCAHCSPWAPHGVLSIPGPKAVPRLGSPCATAVVGPMNFRG